MQSRLFARIACGLMSLLLTLSLPVQAVESITYLHNDAAGSPVAATDAAGNVIWRESYRAYGERTRNETASRANRQFFHGKAFDADTGLSYFGARYYDPVVGRFMAMDPQGFDEANLHSFNRYTYGNNNPYRYTDRDGRFAFLIPLIGLVGGAGLVVAANQPSKPYGSGGSIENSVPGYGTSMLTKLKNLVFNEEAKGQGAESGQGDAQKDVTKRPSRVRKGTEQGNWENAGDGESGGKLCPTCGNEVKSKPGEKNKDWDNDHNPPWRDRELSGKDRKGVLDEYNRDTRLRCVGCNRSDNGN